MARFLDETGLAYFWEKIKAFFQSHQQTIPEYTIEKKQTAEEGYTSSYVLKKDGTQVGATINIPKDYLVRSGEVKTVTVADEPYEGAAVGDKYLDFVVNTVDDSGNTSHIYIPLSDLVDAYIAGNGIQINSSNYISIKINNTQANGLGVGGDGLSLYVATPSVNGVGGNNGAMTATDKEKLDGLPTNAKALQTAVSDPTASGTSIEFVSNITQNENGEITPLKKAVRTMTASGQNHSSGLVPDPGSTAGTTRYLCENGTWSEPNGGGGGTSTPTDVQINGTSITSNNVANVQTEGVYNAVTNKIATMNDLPSTSGFALDSAVVHKTGDETVGGTKTFNSNVVLGANANLVLSTAQDEGVYIEVNSSLGGAQSLIFASLDDDSAVRLENVATPTNNTDAANKQYVDDAVGNTYVSLNGVADTYGILPYSLCAFAFTAYPSSMAMTSFTTSGGTGSKPPITDRWFSIGCKIYYHDSGTASSGSFTSKRFYSTYNGVDARYSAVTGTNVSLSSGKAVYLMVEANANGLWKPFYKSGETNEIIVTDTISAGHFYIYLGRAVGSTGYMFQLEDNNPAAGAAPLASSSFSAGSGISIQNGVISYSPIYKKFDLGQFTVDSTAILLEEKYFTVSDNLPSGIYKVTLMRHISYDGDQIIDGTGANVCLSFYKSGNNTKTYIVGGTYTMPMVTSPNNPRYKMCSVAVCLVGFVNLSSDIESGDKIVIQIDTEEGIVVGADQPLSGTETESVENNDFVMLEKM